MPTFPKFDIYLGEHNSLQGFRLRQHVKDSAPVIATRFSTGSQSQTDLDLLKSVSVDSVEGGMFQRNWEDTKKVARAVGVYNKYDENLYPAPPRSSATSMTSGYVLTARAESNGVTFLAFTYLNAGTYNNRIYRVDISGVTQITPLVGNLAANTGSQISSLCLHKGFLYVGSMNANGLYWDCRYNVTAATWYEYGSYALGKHFVLRDKLYGINIPGAEILIMTNETAAAAVATYTPVTSAGLSPPPNGITHDAIEFNGAAYIAKEDGIFRFDGTTATKILTLRTYQLQVFNGRLYFVSKGWLYSFDGTNLTRLQFFGNQEQTTSIVSMTATSDYLYFSTLLTTSGYADTDKVGPTASGLSRVYQFDGAAWHLLDERDVTLGTASQVSLAVIYDKLYHFVAQFNISTWTTDYYSYDLAQYYNPTAVTSSSKLEITASEFTDGFPNVFKSLEAIEIDCTGLISGDSLAVSYQYYDGSSWSSWISAGSVTSTSGTYIPITNSAYRLFKRLKVNVLATLASGSTMAVKGASYRFTLQPRPRSRWQSAVMTEGDSTIFDRNGDPIIEDPNYYTALVEQLVERKTPSFMLDTSYFKLKTTVDNNDLVFVFNGRAPIKESPYSEYPMIAVLNDSAVWEFLRVSDVSYNSGANETTVTVLERGYLGITPDDVIAGAEGRRAYKVYVTRLLRETQNMDEETYNQQSTGESQIQKEFLLEITEV